MNLPKQYGYHLVAYSTKVEVTGHPWYPSSQQQPCLTYLHSRMCVKRNSKVIPSICNAYQKQFRRFYSMLRFPSQCDFYLALTPWLLHINDRIPDTVSKTLMEMSEQLNRICMLFRSSVRPWCMYTVIVVIPLNHLCIWWNLRAIFSFFSQLS